MVENKKLTLHEKIIEIRKEVFYLQKSKKGQQNNYVPTSEVLAKIIPKMNELGVLLYPCISSPVSNIQIINEKPIYQVNSKINFIFTDGIEKITCPWFLTGKNYSDPAQAFGSALTYAKRYFLYDFFNISMDEIDPDTFLDLHSTKTDEEIEKENELIAELEIILNEYENKAELKEKSLKLVSDFSAKGLPESIIKDMITKRHGALK